jgi:hypothetical protein
MLTAIIITFCLSGQPDRCVDRTDFEPVSGIPACLLESQQDGAEFVKNHPGWFMKSYRCRIGGGRAGDA